MGQHRLFVSCSKLILALIRFLSSIWCQLLDRRQQRMELVLLSPSSFVVTERDDSFYRLASQHVQ